eukprot:Selendium_serpulae@DN5459_c0_g1_i1.p1
MMCVRRPTLGVTRVPAFLLFFCFFNLGLSFKLSVIESPQTITRARRWRRLLGSAIQPTDIQSKGVSSSVQSIWAAPRHFRAPKSSLWWSPSSDESHRHQTDVSASRRESDGGQRATGWRGAEALSSLTRGAADSPLMDIEMIKNVLPHRYPFLLVDKVIEMIPGKKIVGIKQVTSNEPHFNGHFPSRAIMPGVLQVEALAQLGGLLCLQIGKAPLPSVNRGGGGGGQSDVSFLFASVNGVKWKKPVVPGDTLVMEMTLDSFREKLGIAKMSGRAFVDGVMAVDVKEFTFAIVQPNS